MGIVIRIPASLKLPLTCLFGWFLTLSAAQAYPWADVPLIVKTAVLEEVPGIHVDEVERERKNGSYIYEIEGEVNGSEVELKVAADGTILKVEYEESSRREDEEDKDHDGWLDEDENTHGCDPNDPDSDDDTFPDGFEHTHGSDPLDPASQPQIMAIESECVEGGGVCLLIHVQTFLLGRFQLEMMDVNGQWIPVGDAFNGDGSEVVFEMPLPAGGSGMFRTSIVPDTSGGSTSGGSSGTTGSGTCSAPESIVGLTITIKDDEGEAKTYTMDSPTSGEVYEEEDGEIEFYPFDYIYEITGPCSARITITFPSDDEEQKGVVIDITFTSQGIGTVTMRRFEGNDFEDPETGDFYVSSD